MGTKLCHLKRFFQSITGGRKYCSDLIILLDLLRERRLHEISEGNFPITGYVLCPDVLDTPHELWQILTETCEQQKRRGLT